MWADLKEKKRGVVSIPKLINICDMNVFDKAFHLWNTLYNFFTDNQFALLIQLNH